MKKLFYLFSIVLVFSSCNFNQETAEIDKANLQLVELEIGVEGMTCSGCENTVNTELAKLSGVGDVVASHVDKNVILKIDTAVTKLQEVEESIERVGYKVLK